MTLENLNKQELIDWAKDVRAACCDECDDAAARTIDAAIDAYESERFVFSVMGLAKRGKSTLINALLGRTDDKLAPIDALPATNVCTVFSYSDEEKIEVVDRSGNVRRISADEIRDYATEDRNPQNCKDVQLIRVAFPFSEKFKGITLADLPGAGSVHEHHDQIVRQFLPQSDAVLLLTTARMPISADEVDLLKALREREIEKIFVAMNKIDITDEEDLSVGEESNRKKLTEANVPVGTIYKISAKRAFTGEFEESGVPALMSDIVEFVNHRRGELLKKRFIASVKNAAQQTLRAVELTATLSELSPEELSNVSSEFEIRKTEFLRKNEIRSEEFKTRWNRIVGEFESQLPKIRTDVEIELNEEMDSASIANIGRFRKKMPGVFADIVEEKLSAPSQKMEKKLRELVEKYNEDCPGIYVSANGTILTEEHSHAGEIALAGAGTALAVGGGLFATVAGGLTATATTVSPWAAPFLALGSSLGSLVGGATSVTVTAEAGTVAVSTGILDTLIGAGGNFVASIASGLGVSQTTVPTALAIAAGPIGWTIAGVGALALPLAWGFKRHKDLKKMKEAVSQKMRETFEVIETKQIPSLRGMGEAVVAEFEAGWQQQLVAMEASMQKAKLQERSDKNQSHLLECKKRFLGLIEE